MNTRTRFDEFLDRVESLALEGEISQSDCKLLRLCLNPHPSVLNSLAINVADSVDQLWYVRFHRRDEGTYLGRLPDGTQMSFIERDTEDFTELVLLTEDTSCVPLVIWDGSADILSEPLVVRAEIPHFRSAAFPGRMAAAPGRTHLSWTASGSIADAAFVVQPVDVLRGQLDVAVYLKQSVGHCTHVSLQFLDADDEVIQTGTLKNSVELKQNQMNQVFLRGMDGIHRPVAQALIENGQLPLMVKIRFKAPTDFDAVKRMQLVIFPDAESQLAASKTVRPSVFEKDNTGIRIARRSKRYLGLTSEKKVNCGVLMTVGQRTEAVRQVLEHPVLSASIRSARASEAGEIHDDAIGRMTDAIFAGTFCPLAGTDSEAIEMYYQTILRNCQRDRAKDSATRSSVDMHPSHRHELPETISSHQSSTGGDRRHPCVQALLDLMEDLGVADYFELVNTVRERLHIKTETSDGHANPWIRLLEDPRIRSFKDLAAETLIPAASLRSELHRMSARSNG